MDVDALKRMAQDGGTRHMISTPQIKAIVAALERAERLGAVLAAAREVSALDIDYLMRNREAAFAAADKMQDAIDAYDHAALAPAQAEDESGG